MPAGRWPVRPRPPWWCVCRTVGVPAHRFAGEAHRELLSSSARSRQDHTHDRAGRTGDELHQVMLLLESAREGTGGLLVLEGAAGIGKTTILQEAAAIARQDGVLVAQATGHPIESTLSFGLVRQLLEPALARGDPRGPRRARHGTGPGGGRDAGRRTRGRDRRARAGARGVPPGRRAHRDGRGAALVARPGRRAVGGPVVGDLPRLPRAAPGRPAGGHAALPADR